MKFAYNFYTLIIFFTKTVWVVPGEENFDNMELTHLAQKLNPMECLRLLEAMYLKRPMSDEEFAQSETKISLNDESILRRQLGIPFFNRDNCRNKLEEWSRNLPLSSNKWARVAMETELRTLGRPDLAKYIKRNRRVVRYFNEISRNTVKPVTPGLQIASKKIQVTSPDGILKNLAKETVIQYYRKLEGAKSPSENSNPARKESLLAHVGVRKSNDDDSATRWTAFLILLGVIALTILATVIFALYKKNRGNLFAGVEKCANDRCRLADRYSRKPSGPGVDLEQGELTSSMRCGRRRDRRASIQTPPSRSPSSVCVREEIPPVRKPKTRNKCPGVKQQREQQPVELPRRGCSKKCTGIRDRVVKIDKSTRTKDRKISEKCNQSEIQTRPRVVELKKFHDKIASILRRDNPSCKCCKCSVSYGDEGTKCVSTRNKNMCMDEKCEKTKLKSIAELCLSPDESSPTEPESKKKKKKQKKKQQKRKKKSRDVEKDKDTDKEKESEKSLPENSARSKDKCRESRMRKKPAKARKERYNVEEACTRKTCDFGRTNIQEISNFD